MTNRFQQHSQHAETILGGLGQSRFAMIEPSLPKFGLASPSQLHELAFIHARALVERNRWQRLLRKIFEQGE